ncbi:MAG: prolipoprotein diacylglyceryl transferase [Bacilli bacterium]|nr:prolipoprotein diacylglyceryl transferase [Bacilli bacterium]
MKYVFLVFGILAWAGAIFLLIRTLRGIVKSRMVKTLTQNDLKFLGIGLGLTALAGGVCQAATASFLNWDCINGFGAMAIIGAVLFCLSLALLIVTFVLRFWRTDLDPKQYKLIKILLYASIPSALIFFLLWGEGVGPYLNYPLINGVAIGSYGIKWTTAQSGANGGFHIAWYGVIIVLGFITAYAMSDHEFYKKFHKHGILEECLFVVFIFGILGARIWYVVGNWNGDVAGGIAFSKEVAEGRWWRIFAVWEGGLTILGGAVAGIVSGAIYMMLRRKYVNVRWTMDVVIPTILIAQAIGRWGNFFNNEVYGATVNVADGWWWLPTWIKGQMNFDGATGTFLAEGQINVPLFLIEGMLNILGYFVIAKLIPKLWKKHRSLGDLGGFYMIWYGGVRMTLEPLRNASYNMGADGNWSFWNSMIYIIIGVVIIAGFQLYDFIRAKQGKEVKTEENV